MKVLFCTNTFEKVTNGPAKFAHLLLNGASECGFELQILTEDITTEIPKVHKLELKIPRLFRIFGQFIRMWQYHRAAMNLRKEFKFDYLVYNNAIIGLISSFLFKVTVGMINDDNNAVNSFKACIRGKASFNKHLIFHQLEYLSTFFMRRIITNSLYLKKTLVDQYNSNPNKYELMYKGIEDELVMRNRAEIIKRKEARSILFVKNDFNRGGLLVLIDALKLLNEPIKLYIVGVAEIYHSLIQKRLQGSLIMFELYSYKPQGDVYKLMDKCEIFCVPSYLEAFGVANLEAMACGCKIVSTNAGGIPEALGGNQFAWLVEPGNAEKLKEALAIAFETSVEDKVKDISNHLQKFSSTAVISRFKDILQQCC